MPSKTKHKTWIVNKIRNYVRAIYGMSPAALVTLFRDGPQAARTMIHQARVFTGEEVNEKIMSCWAFVRLFSVDKPLMLQGGMWQDGCISPLERFCLAQLLQFFSPNRLLEIGTFKGFTTCLMLDNAPDTAEIVTIDLPPERDWRTLTGATDARLISQSEVGVAFRTHPGRTRVNQVLGDSFKQSTWDNITGGIDFVFIDASHSYAAVRNDSERVFKLVADDAIIAWHDYSVVNSEERGVGKYIRELMIDRDDMFVVQGTDLVVRVPLKVLKERAAIVPLFYPAGDYSARHPEGPIPWVKDFQVK